LGLFFDRISRMEPSVFSDEPGQFGTMLDYFNGFVAHRLIFGPILDSQVD
jgi:hypothetical protein